MYEMLSDNKGERLNELKIGSDEGSVDSVSGVVETYIWNGSCFVKNRNSRYL